jgi:hypothetical protein
MPLATVKSHRPRRYPQFFLRKVCKRQVHPCKIVAINF